MRILIHALAVRQYGGTARHLFNFIPALGAHGAEHQYLLYVDHAALLPTLPTNVTVEQVSVRAALGRVAWDVQQLPRLVRQTRADAVWNLLGFGALDAGAPQIMFQRAPGYYCRYYLDAVQGRERREAKLRRWWQAVIMRRSAHIITPTAAMRDMIRHHHPDLPPTQFTVLPHAFNPAALAGEWPDALETRFAQLPENAVKLLYVGHILPYKDLLFMLDVVAAAAKQMERPLYWFLTIAREDWPDGYDAFVAKVRQLQLEEQVIFLGKVPGPVVGSLYKACDLLLFTSLCESFGWPLLEAISLSRPILAVDVPLNRELAGAGACYYAYGDHTGTVTQLCNLLQDRQAQTYLGQAGYAHFCQTHVSWEEYVTRCHAITQQAIQTKA